MEQNIEFEDEEDIIYEVSLGLNSHNNGSQSSDVFEIDSVISHESSADGLAYHDDDSELSNESPHPTPPDYFQQWIGYILTLRDSPKQLADLNGAKTSSVLGELVRFINLPNVMQLLFQYGFTVYNNEMHGIFIQEAAKEFKQSHGFDEANFPFEDQGGPQKGKLQQYGYVYKYWTGKADKSYKMRKFYQEKGVAIFAVFQEATSPSASPSSSTEIKVDKENTNKKPRVGESPFPSSESSSHSSSPTRPTNAQPSSTGSNYNYSSTGSAPTNYSQQTTPQTGTTNNTNAAPNPLHTTEHIVNRLDALDGRVDGLTTRMTNLELTNVTSRTVTITPLQRQLGILTLQVLRENGGRHQMGKPLATKVRKLFGGSLETKVVNNLLYTVLEPLGIVRLQDKEWVLIDEEKAKQFEQQQ